MWGQNAIVLHTEIFQALLFAFKRKKKISHFTGEVSRKGPVRSLRPINPRSDA